MAVGQNYPPMPPLPTPSDGPPRDIRLSDPPDSVKPPLDVSETELKVAVKDILLQLIFGAGLLVSLLGLPETSWLARAHRFFTSAPEAIPVLALVASMIASLVMLRQKLRKHRVAQTQSFLLPPAVSKSPSNPSSAVVAGVRAARKVQRQVERRPGAD